MSGPSSSFPAFLQARVSNSYGNSPRVQQYHNQHQQQQLRLFQQPLTRTMATQQDADIYGFDTQDGTYGNNNFAGTNDIQSFCFGPTVAMNRMQNFKEMSPNDTSVVSALTNVSQWQEMQHASQGRLPFRPLLPVLADTPVGGSSSNINFRSDNMSLGGSFDSMNTSFIGSVDGSYDGANPSFAGTDRMQPLKVDTSEAALTPSLSILSTPVDPTQYEIVHDAEWVWSSTDYASSTRSSVRTESTGPQTPLSPHSADSFQSSSHYSSHSQGSPSMDVVSKVEGTGFGMFPSTFPRPLLMNCPCTGCTVPGAPHQLSGSWSIGQSEASFARSSSAYGSNASTAVGPTLGFPNLTVTRPFVPCQASPPTTGSLMELERHSPEATEGESEGSESESDEPNVNDQAINDATHRQKRDSFLLNMRRQGCSYKDIKELGNFTEAESTLRGRVRVLTKDKSERVRKPEWDSNDISLLNRAFERYAGFDDDDVTKPRRRELPSRIPWKKISGWMKAHGSSYPFAPATCARKWKALN